MHYILYLITSFFIKIVANFSSNLKMHFICSVLIKTPSKRLRLYWYVSIVVAHVTHSIYQNLRHHFVYRVIKIKISFCYFEKANLCLSHPVLVKSSLRIKDNFWKVIFLLHFVDYFELQMRIGCPSVTLPQPLLR